MVSQAVDVNRWEPEEDKQSNPPPPVIIANWLDYENIGSYILSLLKIMGNTLRAIYV